jgi:hypothetical protein
METGHVNNVASLNTLISRCEGFGDRYNPTNPALTITNLKAIHTGANAELENVNATKPPYINAVSDRQIIFLDMEKLSTRVLNALSSSSNVQDNVVSNSKTLIRKIRGSRKNKLALSPAAAPAIPSTTVPATDTPIQISASQQSYDQQVEHFTKLVLLASSVPAYSPNETELQSPLLIQFIAQLKNANTAVINATTPYLAAIQNRNNIMYAPKTGLVDVALAVKKYVKSVKSINHAEFRQISGLAFRKSLRKSR